MNPIAKLFSKTPSVSEINQKLKELELDQRKKRRDLIMLEQKKQEKVKRAVEAKQAGRQSLVKDLFREIAQVEIDIGYANADLRRLSLSKTALTSFMRKMQLLEQQKDRSGLQKLIERFRDSSFQNTIDKATVDDDTFKDLLEDVLGEEEGAAGQSKARDDLGFAGFDRAIGGLAKVDETDTPEEGPPKSPDDTEPSAAGPLDTHPPDEDRQHARSPDNYPAYGNQPGAAGARSGEPAVPALASTTCPDCRGARGSKELCDNGCDQGEFKKTCPTCKGDREVRCPDCHGKSGIHCPDGPCEKCRPPYSGYVWKYCERCHNSHYAECSNERCKSGYVYHDCEKCKGTGYIWKNCEKCRGTGTIDTEARRATPGPGQAAASPEEHPSYVDPVR